MIVFCFGSFLLVFFFFFNDTATTEIYTLSLHDALPICPERSCLPCSFLTCLLGGADETAGPPAPAAPPPPPGPSAPTAQPAAPADPVTASPSTVSSQPTCLSLRVTAARPYTTPATWSG